MHAMNLMCTLNIIINQVTYIIRAIQVKSKREKSQKITIWKMLKSIATYTNVHNQKKKKNFHMENVHIEDSDE